MSAPLCGFGSGTAGFSECGVPARPRSRWGPAAALLVFAVPALACPAPEGRVTPAGRRLATLLDSMHVESRWIAGHHVNWRTGEPDGRGEPATGHHSHCSAFVAAVAERLGVEILHPPEHSQVLLADAQCAWLAEEGPGAGWRPVPEPLEAQQLANLGNLVVACYASHDPAAPGHVAVVRPQAVTRERIESEGPQVAQAGIENFRSTTLAQGFRNHPRAWGRREVRFYAHPVPPPGQAGSAGT